MAIPWIFRLLNWCVFLFGGLHHRHSLRSPRRFAPRNDVFFFRRLSGAVLAHRTRRNAEDGVPYGDFCPDTPPGVTAPHRCFAQGWPLISMPSAIKMCVSQKQQKLKGFLD